MLAINNYSSSILKNISFELKQGENLLILGENGAGKSTLAKVLCHLIDNQTVSLAGKNITTLCEQERASLINYIPPKLSMFDEYITLREFLELSSIDTVNMAYVDEVIKTLKLESIEQRACLELSSGEQQLALLGSSLIHNASITIFDELTANLDISRLKDVFDILNSNVLQQKIIITHNLDLAYALKYKVLFMKNGQIEFFGSHDEFFTNKSLERFYNKAIIKINEHLVVNL